MYTHLPQVVVQLGDVIEPRVHVGAFGSRAAEILTQRHNLLVLLCAAHLIVNQPVRQRRQLLQRRHNNVTLT